MNRDQTLSDAAYAIWQAEGRPDGRDAEHWRLAEEHIAAGAGEQDHVVRPSKRKASATAARKPGAPAPLKKTATRKTAAKPAPKPKA